jgi:hypothetical protein
MVVGLAGVSIGVKSRNGQLGNPQQMELNRSLSPQSGAQVAN